VVKDDEFYNNSDFLVNHTFNYVVNITMTRELT